MFEVVASVSTQMIQDLVNEEKMSFKGFEVTDQVMALVLVLSRIHKLLKYPDKSEMVLTNIKTLRKLAYIIEDVLETCAVDVAVMFQKKEGIIKRLLRRVIPVMSDVSVLRNIKSKISNIEPEIKNFRQEFPVDAMESICNGEEPRVANQTPRRLSHTYPRGIEKHFVGMDDDLKQLVSLVVASEQHRVISIWGVKGLGKTTIARQIYNHPEVRNRFKAFAWVYLSQVCQIRGFWQDILRQLGPRKVKETAQEQNIKDNLMEVQAQIDCLIVLDNIREIDDWNQLSPAFQMEGVGSKILLTTRDKKIADVGFPYELRLLDEDEGWELLKKHAFPRKDAPDFGMLPKLGKEMVQKCRYLPRAISSLGKNLSSKVSLGEWQMVKNNVSEYLQDYHIEGDEALLNILDSSYDHLPYYPKQCFLYLGIFKANEDIDVEDLFFLWMAEGMVSFIDQERNGTAMDTAESNLSDLAFRDQERRGTAMDTAESYLSDFAFGDQERKETAMDTAESYLSHLAFRDMVQVQLDELSATRRFKSCCLHNLALELSLGEGEKEDFRLKVVDFSDGKQPVLDYTSLSHETRRLAIHFNQLVKVGAQELIATDHLRSLLFLNSDQKYVEMPLKISDFGKFKLLRVLKFMRCKFDGRKLPRGIDKLVNLRYLGLLYCDLDELPESISNLKKLHVLNVRVHDKTQLAIPNVINHIVLLKHLRLPDYTDREQTNKLALGDLLELETLFGFNSLIHDLSTLSNLQKLRRLGMHVYNNDSLKSLVKFIMFYGARIQTDLSIENRCNFTSKEGLAILEEVLMCPNLHALTLSMVLIYKFPDCGTYVSSDITQLKLMGCKITEDPMEALGKFPNLQKLYLGYGAFVGRKMNVQAEWFSSLAYLEFRSLPYLEEWRVDEGAMSKLSALTIRRCPRLKMIPDGLRSISNLKKLEIELAPEAFIDGREAEYLQKFDFVPSAVVRKLDPTSANINNFH